MKETNHETQFKIHFQPFPSIAHIISEILEELSQMLE